MNKYHVAPRDERTYAGVVYHSKAEAIRAAELDLLLRCGEITQWERQVPFILGDVRYVVDFLVMDRDGTTHAEEVKGFETPMFKLNRRLWIVESGE